MMLPVRIVWLEHPPRVVQQLAKSNECATTGRCTGLATTNTIADDHRHTALRGSGDTERKTPGGIFVYRSDTAGMRKDRDITYHGRTSKSARDCREIGVVALAWAGVARRGGIVISLMNMNDRQQPSIKRQ